MSLAQDLEELKALGRADDILVQTCRKLVARSRDNRYRGDSRDFAARRLEVTRRRVVASWRRVRTLLLPDFYEPDFYEPYERLIRIVVLGRVFEVPENNLLLRQMQFVSEDIGIGRYCRDGEGLCCEIQYRRSGDAADQPALACHVKGISGMRLTKLPPEIQYNMSAALSVAPKDVK